MRVALRVAASSVRGLREGIPSLMRLFSTYQVRASFFFPLGSDLSGRSPIHTWHQRRSLGVAALTYGTLWPAPSLRDDALALMRTARQNGHDVGLFGLSPWRWASDIAFADDTWVRGQFGQLMETFEAGGGELPTALASPNWQVHPALLGELEPTRVRYSSLSRGKLPYLPVLQGVRSPVTEIPTTLPTVDELLRQPDVSDDNVHEYLYAESQRVLPAGHVFSVSAEREGQDRLKLMEKLLVMWKGQEGAVRALDDVCKEIDAGTLPHHQMGWATVDGGLAPMATQSIEVPA